TGTLQQNTTLSNPGSSSQSSTETDRNINQRISWNMEYKPNAFDYWKLTPTYVHTSSQGDESGGLSSSRNGIVNTQYNFTSSSTLSSPVYGLTALYDHRFKKPGRNFSLNAAFNSTLNNADQNPVYHFLVGQPTAPLNQQINTYNHTNSLNTSLSYLEPLGQFSFLELNYAFNRSVTNNNKETDAIDTLTQVFYRDPALSNQYNYTFTTNRIGLNFRYVQKSKYNYTLGLAVQPAELSGNSPLTGSSTNNYTFNIIPTAHLVYNFSRSQTLSFNYSGTNNQPNFTQLQPVTDFSNALYPVQGNPDLKPSFTNNFSLQYNRFDFASGKTLFTNFSFVQTQNQVVTNTLIYPAVYKPDPQLANTYFTKYLNADGFYTASGYISYANPWANRKYTILLNGTVSYNNNLGYLTNVDPITYQQNTEKNIAKNLIITPGIRFRVDLPEIIDVQFLTNYSFNTTQNSVQSNLTNATSNVRTWNIGLSGKNYFHDWTLSYDYSKVYNYGYASSVNATNPNILNAYLERRFLKGHRATVRLAAFDLFNQNTGFSTTTTASSITQTNTNRLGRYFLATFTLRLQKFGK
ncbi:MAG: outer membrane beta-barrel protein, partial [Mucilaginibacter sp.]